MGLTTSNIRLTVLYKDRSRLLFIIIIYFSTLFLMIQAAQKSQAEHPDDVKSHDLAGEFEIPLTVVLNRPQLQHLAVLVASDEEARALAEQIVSNAQSALSRGPEPLEVIEYEGLVNTDQRRVATVASLNQMGDIARLFRAWQVNQNAQVAAHLRRLIRAWTGRYVITGNEVNENKFCPLLMAYASLRETFSPQDVRDIDAWVRELGTIHYGRSLAPDGVSNRYVKHLRLTALCAQILDEPRWADAALEGARRMIDHGLFADGSSHDLRERDSLTYHGSAVKGLIELSLLVGTPDGEPPLYDWVSPSGASIRNSVNYVIPYATGEKTREEWRNSKVELDRQRSAAGIAQYQPGKLYEPREAKTLLELACFYEPTLRPLVAKLSDSPAERFPTWMTLMSGVISTAADTQ